MVQAPEALQQQRRRFTTTTAEEPMVMSYTLKIGGELRPVNTLTVPVVRDDGRTATGARIPSADLHSRRVSREAERWLTFAKERSRMREDTLVRKALHSVAFSVQHRAKSLAIPSKLAGTKANQRALWGLVREIVPRWTELDVEEVPGGAIVVSYEGEGLGEVQSKHGWLRPLIPFGARVYLGGATGHSQRGYTLGCNVVFGHVGSSLDGLLHALGASGDGAARSIAVEPPPSPPADAGGDGAVGAVLPVYGEHEALTGPSEDVVLWREGGTARASVPHAVRHSPTGVEWGYAGSGPADLARSILLAFTDEAMADRHYQELKAEVIARVPHEGGVIRAADVRAWLAARGASSAPSVA